LETIGSANDRDFSLKIRFHQEFDIFSSKSQEKRRLWQNTFALLLHNTVAKRRAPVELKRKVPV